MLSDTWLRKANGKPIDKETVKADRDGLSARIRKTGAISFIFRARLKSGESIKMTLGKYPELTLKEARDKTEKYRAYIADGKDPRREREMEVFRNVTALTVDQAYATWYESYVSKNKKNHAGHKRSYELHIQPQFGTKLLKDLTRRDWVQELIALGAKTPEIASRLAADMKQLYDFTLDTGLLEGVNVLAGVDRKTIGVVKGQRTRILSDEDIVTFYQVLKEKRWNPKNKIIIELLLFYGCRSQELRHCRRDWVDLDKMTWTVPPEYHKTGKKTKRPLVRPILPEMVHLWEQALDYSTSPEFVFTAMVSKSEKGSTQMSAGAVQDLPYKMISHVRDHHTDEDGNPATWEKWTNHDLRRTARSRWSRYGDWATCEKMLGHKLAGEADVYDRHDYLEQMTPIYRQWWNELKRFEQGDRKVVPLYKKEG